MGSETINGPVKAEAGDESPAVNRFDRIVELLNKDKATGWVQIPEGKIAVRGRLLPARFFLNIPRPIEGYESAYSPSMLLEVGRRRYRKIDGKPYGSIKKFFVRRAALEPDNPQFDEEAETALGNIESKLPDYKF